MKNKHDHHETSERCQTTRFCVYGSVREIPALIDITEWGVSWEHQPTYFITSITTVIIFILFSIIGCQFVTISRHAAVFLSLRASRGRSVSVRGKLSPIKSNLTSLIFKYSSIKKMLSYKITNILYLLESISQISSCLCETNITMCKSYNFQNKSFKTGRCLFSWPFLILCSYLFSI